MNTIFTIVAVRRFNIFVAGLFAAFGCNAAGPSRCTAGYQDSSCATVLLNSAKVAPVCSSDAGWITTTPADWIGSKWSTPVCTYIAPPACPSGYDQTAAPSWNGAAWVGLGCQPKPTPQPPACTQTVDGCADQVLITLRVQLENPNTTNGAGSIVTSATYLFNGLPLAYGLFNVPLAHLVKWWPTGQNLWTAVLPDGSFFADDIYSYKSRLVSPYLINRGCIPDAISNIPEYANIPFGSYSYLCPISVNPNDVTFVPVPTGGNEGS